MRRGTKHYKTINGTLKFFNKTETFFSQQVFTEGGVRGVRKPQNRIEIRQKTANRIGFFPEYRNRAYM